MYGYLRSSHELVLRGEAVTRQKNYYYYIIVYNTEKIDLFLMQVLLYFRLEELDLCEKCMNMEREYSRLNFKKFDDLYIFCFQPGILKKTRTILMVINNITHLKNLVNWTYFEPNYSFNFTCSSFLPWTATTHNVVEMSAI